MTQSSSSLLEDTVDELEAVIGDISGFLQNFCSRLERLTTTAPIPRDATREAGGIADQQVEWEANRLSVERKLRDQVDLLADAWLRLEEEQSSLLQMKKGRAENVTNRVPATASNSFGSALQDVSDSSRVPRQLQHSAVLEFDRLRQEIQSSRLQNNGK